MPSFSDIQSNPCTVTQLSGCCGFAAVVMALLTRKSAAIYQLAACASKGQPFRSITKSTHVRNRLLKRKRGGIIPSGDTFDQELCVALMILFKEYCRQSSNQLGAQWRRCLDFSVLFGWDYSTMNVTQITGTTTVSKLKNVPQGAVRSNGLSFPQRTSYKLGDLAMPADVMPSLLKMVGLTVQRHGVLTRSFPALATKTATQAKATFKKFQDEMQRIQTGRMAPFRFKGDVILGVGDEPTNQRYAQYHYVTHWVYVPATPQTAPGNDEFRCWTWGNEHDFWATMAGFYPAYGIYLG